MKKAIIFIVLIIITSVVFAQDCEKKLESAKNYYNNEQYEKAKAQFELIIRDCGDNYGGAKIYLDKCIKKLNEINAILTINKTTIDFPSYGGHNTITVTSNNPWQYDNHPSWIKPKASGDKLIIDCEKNTTTKERVGYIRIFSGNLTKSIRVTQEKDELSINKSSIRFTSDGGEMRINVHSNAAWNIDRQNFTWYEPRINNEEIIITCKQNTTVDSRNGMFTIRSVNGDYVKVDVSQNGEKATLSVTEQLHFESDGGRKTLYVKTNATDWYVGAVNVPWCKATKKSANDLSIEVRKNESNVSRRTQIRVYANKSTYKDIFVSQENRSGYSGLVEDYYDYLGGERKTTYFEINAYILGNYGIRMSTLMYRWKFVEFDALNMNFSLYDSMSIDWEPMVRGYLPLNGSGRCWAVYIGIGPRVNFYENSWKQEDEYDEYYTYNNYSTKSRSSIVFETGVEYNWVNRDDTSTRLFLRYDGYTSVGIAFDLCQWNY